jgi:hypothetical protein
MQYIKIGTNMDQKIGTRFTSGNKTNYLERESSPHSNIFNYDENHNYEVTLERLS